MKRLEAMRLAGVAGVLVGVGVLACNGTSVGGSRTGNLGKGGFSYQCVDSAGDFACASLPGAAQNAKLTPSTFPTSVAEGAAFGIVFQPTDERAAGNPSLRPVASDYIQSTSPGEFQALKAGRSGIVARSSADGRFVDYTLVSVVPVSKLRIYGATGALDTLELSVNQTADVRGVPLGPRAEPVAGALPYEWSSSAPDIVKVEVDSPLSKATARALKAGSAKLTITRGELTTSIDVTVK